MWNRAGWFVFAAIFWCSIDLGMGTSRADDVQVNTYTTSSQNVASVSLDADGDFVVAWSSLGSPGSQAAGDTDGLAAARAESKAF